MTLRVLSASQLRPLRILFVSTLIIGSMCNVSRATSSDFSSWLKKHGAYEALDLELADKEQTPEILLERVKILLKLGRAAEAKDLLRSSAAFVDDSLEHDRLWLLGTASRQAGDLPDAVAAWSLALGSAPDAKDVKRLASEPGFPAAWQDVCRIWIWRASQTTDTDMDTSVARLLRSALATGKAVWPSDPFWKHLEDSLARPPQTSPTTLKASKGGETIPPADRTAASRALALFSLGNSRAAQDMADAISDKNLKLFWKFFFESLTGWKTPPFAENLRAEELLPAAAFCEGVLPALLSDAPEAWLLPEPGLLTWPRINARLALATPEQAASIIDTELGGSDVDPLSAERLRQHGLAYALAANDDTRADALLAELDPARLSLPLKLALTIGRGADPRAFFHGPEAGPGLGLACALAEVCGLSALTPVPLPFWERVSAGDLQKDADSHPFDRNLLMAAMDAAWRSEKSSELARRLGFLFPRSPAGVEALVMLAVKAGKAGDLEASAAYLNLIDPERVTGPARLDWLQAKAALEIELGLDERALASYTELYRLEPARFTPTKLLRFALLAQRQEQHELALQVLTILWRDKDSLAPAEQAETLFWMAESAESLGRQSEALRDYLRVAWRYPEENMWATTALYRAALIYERTGRTAPAKDLLAMVVKNADRKSQREQAEQKLQQLEQRGKGGKKGTADNVGYPF